MSFGLKITELRKKKSMTQEQLASELGVTRQTISKWELDQSTPDLNYINQLSELFEVTTDFLIKENVTETENKKEIESESVAVNNNTYRVPERKKMSPKEVGGIVAIIAGVFLFITGIVISTVEYVTGSAMGMGLLLAVLAPLVIIVGIELMVSKRNTLLKIMWTIWLYISGPTLILGGLRWCCAIPGGESDFTMSIFSLLSVFALVVLIIWTVNNRKKIRSSNISDELKKNK